MILTVKQISQDHIFADRANIHGLDRPGIQTGHVCRIQNKANGKAIYREVRNGGQGEITLDNKARDALDLKQGHSANLEITSGGWRGLLVWSWCAANPTNRIPARLGMIGLAGC